MAGESEGIMADAAPEAGDVEADVDVDGQGGNEGGGEEGGGESTARAPAKAKPAAKRRVKYRSDGVDYEEELTDEDIAARLGRDKASYKRMGEAARERKEIQAERAKLADERKAMEAAQKGLAGDPAALRKFLRDQIGDPVKAHRLLVQAMKAEIDELNLDPREKELMELKAERDARAAADKEAEEARTRETHERELKAAIEKHRPVMIERLGKVLEAMTIPKNEITLSIAADVYTQNAKENLGLSNEEMAQFIHEESVGYVASLTDTWTGEDWEKQHPKAFKAIAAHLLAKARGRKSAAAGDSNREGPTVRKRDEGRMVGGKLPPPKTYSDAEAKKIFGG